MKIHKYQYNLKGIDRFGLTTEKHQFIISPEMLKTSKAFRISVQTLGNEHEIIWAFVGGDNNYSLIALRRLGSWLKTVPVVCDIEVGHVHDRIHSPVMNEIQAVAIPTIDRNMASLQPHFVLEEVGG